MALEISDFRYIYHQVGGVAARFEVSDQDTSDATYQYFGYLHSEGAWVIQRFEITATTISYRYATGKDEYATAWAAKATWPEATWKYFNDVTTL